MENKEYKIKIKEKEYEVLTIFEYKNNNYIVYTDYQKNDSGNIQILYSQYENKGEKIQLKQIENKEDEEYIKEHLKTIEQDLREGIVLKK